jgi:hypothetical protein
MPVDKPRGIGYKPRQLAELPVSRPVSDVSDGETSGTPSRSVPIDGTTHIPEELFKGLLKAGKEARRRGQHEMAEEPRQRRQHLVMAGGVLTAPVSARGIRGL